MIGPIRSMLFVPGTRHDRFAKAMNAGADAVVFDLEDSVDAGQKQQARSLVAEFLATRRMEEIRPETIRPEALRLVRFNAGHDRAAGPTRRRAGRAGRRGAGPSRTLISI